jgi:acyl carrier protein
VIIQQPDTVAESSLTWLRSFLARLLNVSEQEVAPDQPLGELGIDSLTAAEFSAELEEYSGVTVPLEFFLGESTLAELAHELAASMPELAASVPRAGAGPARVTAW